MGGWQNVVVLHQKMEPVETGFRNLWQGAGKMAQWRRVLSAKPITQIYSLRSTERVDSHRLSSDLQTHAMGQAPPLNTYIQIIINEEKGWGEKGRQAGRQACFSF